MENALKKLSAEIKANLEAAMSSTAVKDLIASTKAAEDAGTFEVVVSTPDDDRSGESVDPNGMDMTLFKMNPVVLWGHDYYALPIGVCDSIEVIEGKIVAKGRFAPADANPFAQQVRKLYDAKIVRATSIGFIVKEMNGKIITKGELLEFSFVPVPANPYALSLSHAKSLGLDVAMLAMKGLNDLMKKEEGEDTPEPEAEVVAEAEVTEPTEEATAEVVVEDTPAGDDVATTEETPEVIGEKGAIADEVTDIENRPYRIKWKNAEKVSTIIDAFYNLYFMEETAPEDFEVLIAEVATLLGGLTNATAGEKIAKTILEGTMTMKTFVRTKAEDDMIKAIGAELATMQASMDTTATDSAAKIMEILNGGATTEEAKSADDGDIPEDVAIEEATSVQPDAIKELSEFEKDRQIVRTLATAVTNTLENFNKKAREHEAAKVTL